MNKFLAKYAIVAILLITLVTAVALNGCGGGGSSGGSGGGGGGGLGSLIKIFGGTGPDEAAGLDRQVSGDGPSDRSQGYVKFVAADGSSLDPFAMISWTATQIRWINPSNMVVGKTYVVVLYEYNADGTTTTTSTTPDADNSFVATANAGTPPVITSVTGATALPITVKGTGFGTTTNYVGFLPATGNMVFPAVTSWSDTQVVVDSTGLAAGTYGVYVFAGSAGKSNKFTFNYGGGTPTGPTASTLNGYTCNPATGDCDLDISATDANNAVVTSGTISDVNCTDCSVRATVTYTVGTITNIAPTGGTAGPKTCSIDLDATGSMAGSDPNRLRKTAAEEFVKRMTAADTAAVSSFDTDTTPTAPYLALKVWQVLTSDKTLLNTAIGSATFELGSTNLWDATYDSGTMLAPTTSTNKMALILTDGNNNSSTKTIDEAIAQCKSGGVKVYNIGLGSSVNETELQKVSRETGGTYNFAADASQLNTIFNGMFNSGTASGKIIINFLVDNLKPVAGTKIGGKLNYKIDGNPFTQNFLVTY